MTFIYLRLLTLSASIGFCVTWFTKPESMEKMRGLVWGTIPDAIRAYKGSEGTESEGPWASAAITTGPEDQTRGSAGIALATVSKGLAASLEAKLDDLIYVTDRRWWLGGLQACHAIIHEIAEEDESRLELGPTPFARVVSPGRESKSVRVQRLY